MYGENYKEVYFDPYCSTCKHCKKKETEDPCDDCLNEPVNLYSHKPVYGEEEEDKKKKTETKNK